MKPGVVVIDARRRPLDEVIEHGAGQKRAPLELGGNGAGRPRHLGDDGRGVLVHEIGERLRPVEAEVRRLLDRRLLKEARGRRQGELAKLPPADVGEGDLVGPERRERTPVHAARLRSAIAEAARDHLERGVVFFRWERVGLERVPEGRPTRDIRLGLRWQVVLEDHCELLGKAPRAVDGEHEPALAGGSRAEVAQIDPVDDRLQPQWSLIEIELPVGRSGPDVEEQLLHGRARRDGEPVDVLGRQPVLEQAQGHRRCLIGRRRHLAHQVTERPDAQTWRAAPAVRVGGDRHGIDDPGRGTHARVFEDDAAFTPVAGRAHAEGPDGVIDDARVEDHQLARRRHEATRRLRELERELTGQNFEIVEVVPEGDDEEGNLVHAGVGGVRAADLGPERHRGSGRPVREVPGRVHVRGDARVARLGDELILLGRAEPGVVVGDRDVVVEVRVDRHRAARRRIHGERARVREAGEGRQRVRAYDLGRDEDLVDDAVEELRLRRRPDAKRREHVCHRPGSEDLTELLSVDEQEDERAVEHTGHVRPCVCRDRRAGDDRLAGREDDRHLDVPVVNPQGKRGLVVEPLEDDRLVAAHGVRVHPRGHRNVRPHRELRLVGDLHHVLHVANLHAEAVDPRDAGAVERMLSVRAAARRVDEEVRLGGAVVEMPLAESTRRPAVAGRPTVPDERSSVVNGPSVDAARPSVGRRRDHAATGRAAWRTAADARRVNGDDAGRSANHRVGQRLGVLVIRLRRKFVLTRAWTRAAASGGAHGQGQQTTKRCDGARSFADVSLYDMTHRRLLEVHE